MDRSSWIPLASLFSTLLSGCFAQSSCSDFKGGTFERTVDLAPERYAQYEMGIVPESTTEDPTSTGGTSTGGTTTGTGGDSTGGSTGGSPGGMMLSEQETCALVCMHEAPAIGDLESCAVSESADLVRVTCVYPAYCEGRRHACVTSRGETEAADAVAAWLARAAHDEAASVHAFRALARELSAWGAPPELLVRIEAAAADEERHAAVTAALARGRGAEVVAPAVAEVEVRSLLAIARENAAEGCVRETWAALSAAHQARCAADPMVRRIYAAIAADETRHAELAWAIDAWLMGQIDGEGRAAVIAARRTAAVEVAAAVAAVDAPELAELGVPPPQVAARLCAGLDAALWSRAA